METIKTVKCTDPYTEQEVWNGKIIVDEGNIEGISDNSVNITYIRGHLLVNGISFSLIRNNCYDEMYNLERIDSSDDTESYSGICTNSFDKQYKRKISIIDDDVLVEEKVKGLKKQISDYKRSIIVGD